MLSKLGHKNFTLIAKMMDLMAERERVIASNIANVNTPNYQRRTYNFEKSLNWAISRGKAPYYRRVRGHIARPEDTPVRNNGNNVDIDMEMQNLNFTGQSYQIYSELYNRRANLVKMAMGGGR